jgi:hypothetical protein
MIGQSEGLGMSGFCVGHEAYVIGVKAVDCMAETSLPPSVCFKGPIAMNPPIIVP